MSFVTEDLLRTGEHRRDGYKQQRTTKFDARKELHQARKVSRQEIFAALRNIPDTPDTPHEAKTNEPARTVDSTAIAFPLAGTHRESRKEQLLRWQEERRQKQMETSAKNAKKKPFLVGIASAHAHGAATAIPARPAAGSVAAVMSARKPLGISGTASRVRQPLGALNHHTHEGEAAEEEDAPPSVVKDSRKNLTSVFRSSDVALSAITDMLNMKLDFDVPFSLRAEKNGEAAAPSTLGAAAAAAAAAAAVPLPSFSSSTASLLSTTTLSTSSPSLLPQSQSRSSRKSKTTISTASTLVAETEALLSDLPAISLSSAAVLSSIPSISPFTSGRSISGGVGGAAAAASVFSPSLLVTTLLPPSHEYRMKMTTATADLTKQCDMWKEIAPTLPAEREDIVGDINAVIGMATLLIKDKLKQFAGLCDALDKADSGQKVTLDDLSGFWEGMIQREVDQLHRKFDRLDTMRTAQWREQHGPPAPKKTKKTATPSRKTKKAATGSTPGRQAARERLAAARQKVMQARATAGAAAAELEDEPSASQPMPPRAAPSRPNVFASVVVDDIAFAAPASCTRSRSHVSALSTTVAGASAAAADVQPMIVGVAGIAAAEVDAPCTPGAQPGPQERIRVGDVDYIVTPVRRSARRTPSFYRRRTHEFSLLRAGEDDHEDMDGGAVSAFGAGPAAETVGAGATAAAGGVEAAPVCTPFPPRSTKRTSIGSVRTPGAASEAGPVDDDPILRYLVAADMPAIAEEDEHDAGSTSVLGLGLGEANDIPMSAKRVEVPRGSVQRLATITPSRRARQMLGTDIVFTPVRRSMRLDRGDVLEGDGTGMRACVSSLARIPATVDYGFLPPDQVKLR